MFFSFVCFAPNVRKQRPRMYLAWHNIETADSFQFKYAYKNRLVVSVISYSIAFTNTFKVKCALSLFISASIPSKQSDQHTLGRCSIDFIFILSRSIHFRKHKGHKPIACVYIISFWIFCVFIIFPLITFRSIDVILRKIIPEPQSSFRVLSNSIFAFGVRVYVCMGVCLDIADYFLLHSFALFMNVYAFQIQRNAHIHEFIHNQTYASHCFIIWPLILMKQLFDTSVLFCIWSSMHTKGRRCLICIEN